ncbi:hypothetical protein EDD11_000382, partial [Mortierella claussenii]
MMSVVRQSITEDGTREFAPGVARHCWFQTIRDLGGTAQVLGNQLKDATTWDEMESLFRAWFTLHDKCADALDWEALVWEPKVPIAQFGQIFRNLASKNDFVRANMSEKTRRWLAHRFLRNFPVTWTFAELMTKHEQAPHLDDLIKQAIEEQRLHPLDGGIGRYQRPTPRVSEIMYVDSRRGNKSFSETDARGQPNNRMDAPTHSGQYMGRKRSYEQASERGSMDVTDSSFKKKIVCFACQQPGHFKKDCPKAIKALDSGNVKGKQGRTSSFSAYQKRDTSGQGAYALVGHMTAPPSVSAENLVRNEDKDTDEFLFDATRQVDENELALERLRLS